MTEPTIKLILLQFPTPWKLKENGNLYLPSSQDDDKINNAAIENKPHNDEKIAHGNLL